MKKYGILLQGDCLERLKELEDNSIDSCVCDPPYGLQFMNKGWDYDVPKTDIWKAVYRVLKPGGHLVAFFGTRTYHRGVVNIEDAGFEIRDQLQWLYGTGFPKSYDMGKQGKKQGIDNAQDWDGWGTGLKPANEPIVLARKPLSEKTVSDNLAKWGTGALNIGECRANGRHPANVIHDGSDEVLSRLPITGKSASVKGTEPSSVTKDIYGKFNNRVPFEAYGDEGSVGRFFYCSKTTNEDREEGTEKLEAKISAASEFRPNHMEKTEAGEGGNPYGRFKKRRNNHPTVKPTDLMRYLCRLVTPKNGKVLDPFMGSGSTGKAAIIEGFHFIGIELDPEYFKIATERVNHALKKQKNKLFN